jgi:hypothetical protein
LDITQRLNIDDPQAPQWRETLAKLIAYPTDANGYEVSATVPFSASHRHYSHLLMIYPLHLVTPDLPENQQIIHTAFKHWTDLSAAWRGFSYTGAASISALLGRGDDAGAYLNTLLDKLIKPNTMYVEAGPVIETPLSAAAALHDMLLTGWGSKIRVFPGVPTAWTEIAFRDLRTEGAFLVSAVRKAGALQFIRILSLAGEPCHLITDMPNPQVQAGSSGVAVTETAPGEYELSLKRGDWVVLTSGGASVDMQLVPVAAQPGRTNFWGLH